MSRTSPDLPTPRDVSTSTSQDLRCPSCAAHVRAGSDWCTLCYSDLRPAPAEEAPSQPPANQAPVVVSPSDAVAPPRPVAAGPRGKHARRDASEASLDPEATAQVLLARLAAAESGNPLGRYSAQLDSPGKKVALMAGGAVVATSLLFLVMLVLGALL